MSINPVKRLLAVAGILLIQLVACNLAVGQSPPEPQSEIPAPSDRTFQIKEGFIQPDQRIWISGPNDRALMQYSLDELRELERVRREATQMPSLLASATLNIQVEESSALVRLNFVAESGGRSTLQRFSLGLKSCQLIESPKFESNPQTDIDPPQQQLVPTPDGYQWLLLSPKTSKNQLSLVARTPVDRSTDRPSVSMDLPLATTTIDVVLPPNATEERVRNDDMIVSREADEHSVRLQIRSRGGPFSVSWQTERLGNRIGSVEAKSDTVYEPFDLLNPSQPWSVTTSLSIQWNAQDGKQRVRIQLPRGGKWNELPYSELERIRWETIPAATDDGDDASDLTEVLVIENLDPAAFPTVENLTIEWQWSPDSDVHHSPGATYSVQAPEIEGVDSHGGTISVIFPSGFEFSYTENAGAKFVKHDRIAESGSGRQQIQFAFQQPQTGVDVTFQKEQFLPTIRPTYAIHVRENRIELTAWFRVWFEGSEAEFGLVPGGWTLDEGSASVIRDLNHPTATVHTDVLSVLRRDDGSFVLSSRQSDSGSNAQRVEQLWRVTAYRDWAIDGDQALELQLPAILRDPLNESAAPEYGSGVLLITSDNYLMFQHDQERSAGLWPDSYLPEFQVYHQPSTKSPLLYRFQDRSQPPRWVGRPVVLSQQIRVRQQAELEVTEDRIHIQQQFDLQVSNRALNQLRFRVRKDAMPVRIVVGDSVLPYEELPDATNDGVEPEWRQIGLVGMSELLGSFQVAVRTSVPWSALKSAAPDASTEPGPTVPTVEVDLPLVQLLTDGLQDGAAGVFHDISENGIAIRSNSQYDVEFVHAKNSRANSDHSGSRRTLKPDQSNVLLSIHPRFSRSSDPTETNGVWLQTLLAGNDRRDRFVARVLSSRKQVVIQLPEQALLDKVALDGAQLGNDAAPYDYNTNQIVVSLPDESEHVVEVIYMLSEPLKWVSRFTMTPAQVMDADAQDRFYWQLVTPGTFHLAWCPPEMTAEWTWQRQSLWWSRISSFDQPDLEQWIGASTLSRLPSGTNNYVMSGLEQFPTVNVWILSRFAFWLPVGLFAILSALVTLNFPMVRRPNSLVFLAGIIFAAAMIWPDMAALFGQTAFVSLGLVAVVWLTQVAVQSRVSRRSIFSYRASGRVERSGSTASASRGRSGSLTDSASRAAVVESGGAE